MANLNDLRRLFYGDDVDAGELAFLEAANAAGITALNTLDGEFVRTPKFDSAARWVAGTGSPSISQYGMEFDDTTPEAAGAPIAVPYSWETVDVSAVCSQFTGNGGDVVLNLTNSGADQGDRTVAISTSAGLTTQVGTWTGLSTSPFGVDSNLRGFLFSLRREAGDVGDTLTGDMTVYGLIVQKGS